METSNPVLSGLIRKRQEVAAELDAAQARLRLLTATLDAVDTTIRLFKPDIDLKATKVRPAPRRQEGRGGTSRLILSTMREAGQPLTHREVTQRMMQARGMDLADKKLVRVMRGRVGSSLRGMRERGRLVSANAPGDGMRWRVA